MRVVLLTVIALFITFPAYAQETQPGDACIAGETGWYRGASEGAAGGYAGNMMVCDGSNWVGFINYQSTGDLALGSTGAIAVPDGTTAQQPAVPENGMIRYNTTTNKFEGYENGAWTDLAGGFWVDGAGDDIYYDAATPQVGIGLTNPTYTLDVDGDIRLSSGLVFDPTPGAATPSFISFSDLDDVSAASPLDAQVVSYDSASSTWVPSSSAINDLSDAYTIYDAGVTSNFIMGRTGAAALTADAFRNLFIGEGAGATSANSTATTDWNLAIGYNALTSLTSGYSNVAIGGEALETTTTGYRNTGIGVQALKDLNDATGNVAVGYQAVSSNVSGTQNTGMGYQVMQDTTGQRNVAIGAQAMRENTDGDDNVAIGRGAGFGVSTVSSPDFSIFIGRDAGYGITTGQHNIILGYQAGYTTTTGDRNILIGSGVDASAAGANNELNIGDIIYASGVYNATAHIGIMNTSPNVELDVTGDIEYTGTITDMSDRRLKTDITNLSDGQLSKITALQGVSFKMKEDPEGGPEFGFIAQDVQPLFPELVYERNGGMLSMNYTGLIAPMIEAIKEQQAIIDKQRQEIETQQSAINDLSARLETLEARYDSGSNPQQPEAGE